MAQEDVIPGGHGNEDQEPMEKGRQASVANGNAERPEAVTDPPSLAASAGGLGSNIDPSESTSPDVEGGVRILENDDVFAGACPIGLCCYFLRLFMPMATR